MSKLPSPDDRGEFEDLPDAVDPDDVPDQWLELEYYGRLLETKCRSIEDTLVRSDGQLIVTTNRNAVGLLSTGGPTDYFGGSLLDYLRDELGFRVVGWQVSVDDDELDGPMDPGPEDVDINLSRDGADMTKIRKKWIHDQITMVLRLELQHSELSD